MPVHQPTRRPLGIDFLVGVRMLNLMPYADPEKAREYAAKYARDRRARLKAAGQTELPYLTDAERANRRSEYSKASTYGVGTSELRRWYAETWSAQGGACAICAKPFEGSPESPVQRGRGGSRVGMAYVDHDHDTRKLRGLLCHRCNLQVGCVEKNTSCAIAAVDYVLRHLDTGRPGS